MKTGTKIVIAVSVVVGAAATVWKFGLFGTREPGGIFDPRRDMTGGLPAVSFGQATSGTSGTLRAPPARTGRAVPLTDAQRDEMRSMGIAWTE